MALHMSILRPSMLLQTRSTKTKTKTQAERARRAHMTRCTNPALQPTAYGGD